LFIHWIANHPAISLGIFLAATLAVALPFRNAKFKLHRQYAWALAAASVAPILLFAAVAIDYVRTPQFRDHVEPQIAAVSCLLMRGKALYPAPTAAEQYSLPYGPYSYLWVTAYYWLMGPSITAVKLSAAVSALAGLGFLLAACWRTAGWRVALPCAALAPAVYLRFEYESLWCRPDTHQLFLISLSIFALTLSNPWWAAILIGISTGIDINMKVDAAAYAIPIATAFYLRHRRLSPLLLAALLAVGAAMAPFALSAISLTNYLEWMRLASHHPFAVELPDALAFAGWLVALPLICGLPSVWQRHSDTPRRDWWITAASLIVAILITLPVAAKRGAGAHHLLPLVPVICWLIARAWSIGDASPADQISLRHVLIFPTALLALIFACVIGFALVSKIEREMPANIAIQIDLQNIADALPDRTILMGVGGDASYPYTFSRPTLVYDGNPYPLDAAAAMDSFEDQRGLPPAALDLFRSGPADVLLIPRGDDPFTLTDWYRAPSIRFVFSDQFLNAFHDNYAIRYHSTFFDVYVRKAILNTGKASH
jgi:hypothetical protein